MPAERGRSAVAAALEKAAKLAERQALMNAAANTVLLRYGEVYSDDLRDLLPWSTGMSCTQVTHTPPNCVIRGPIIILTILQNNCISVTQACCTRSAAALQAREEQASKAVPPAGSLDYSGITINGFGWSWVLGNGGLKGLDCIEQAW